MLSNFGMSKLAEECGELIQVAMKAAALGGLGKHWDGTYLIERLEEEMADVLAICRLVREKHALNHERMKDRADRKYELFQEWDKSPN